ncbi:MAG: cofactor-independent phosphoglycerate mutase [Desulfofustis sp.]|nr:cofactor-independent phosphoglycerate mutase [Desulfofustis sp.]
MKYLILVGDGMGDHPLVELGNRTPLQAAATPVMDALSRTAQIFEVTTVPDGFHPGSDIANMSLLGYDPAQYYTGRAPLEAASMGIPIAGRETAFRCNLVTIVHEPVLTRMVDFSAGHITSEEAAELIGAVQQQCGNDWFHFHKGISYRHLLLVQDPISDMATVPPHDYIGNDVSGPYQAYLRHPDWRELMLTAQQVLAEHPVNRRRIANGRNPATCIWPWGSGKMPAMPSLNQRFGITGTMISAVDLLNGLGVCTGLNIAQVEGATGYIDTNYAGKAQAALDALARQDFVFVHLEAPDEAGHQGRLDHKIQAIEDFDRRIVGTITEALHARGEAFRVVVTMDHFTPLSIRTHTAEPVPALLYDSRDAGQGKDCSFAEHLLEKNPAPARVVGHRLINRLLEKEG